MIVWLKMFLHDHKRNHDIQLLSSSRFNLQAITCTKNTENERLIHIMHSCFCSPVTSSYFRGKSYWQSVLTKVFFFYDIVFIVYK